MLKIPRLRWLIAVALFLAAVLNYVDRNVLGLLAPTIQKDLAISDQQYAMVVNFFLIAYTIAYLLSGRIVDKLGVRLSMALFVAWWSVSNALTGLAQGVKSLSVFRFMLGLGEAGGFTASPKAVGEWFPPSERGVAVGMYSMGGAVGATIAPFLVVFVATKFGWRWTFLVTLLMAWTWLALWLWLYRRPAEHPRLTDSERDYLLKNIAAPADAPAMRESEWSLWKGVFKESCVWQLMLGRLLTDPVWYFYQFWMPKYLHSARGMEQKDLSIMWMIFLAADAGFLLGGFLSGRLIRRGLQAPRSRVWMLLVSACLVPVSACIPFLPAVWMVIALSMVITFAHTSWLTNITSLVVDITPKRVLGTAFGVIACGSALGGIFMNQTVAWLIKNYSYDYCFYLMLLLHPTALLLVWALRKRPVAA